MTEERYEISFYPEIQRFIEMQLTSNFLAERKKELSVFWGIGELKTNLKKIIDANPEKCHCALPFSLKVPMLNLDIFALITDGRKFELLILEVKRMNNAGLKEWSQLLGYCMVSGAKYGLLINIDHGASSRLSQILSSEEHISHVREVIDNNIVEHCLGFIQWDSLTHDFSYTNLGKIKTISDLSSQIIASF